MDTLEFTDASMLTISIHACVRVKRRTRDGCAIDEPMASLAVTLVRPRRARVDHHDGVRASNRLGRVGGRHRQVRLIQDFYI